MKFGKIIFAFLFAMGSLSAQNFIHKISPFPSVKIGGNTDTVKILAVMVEFQSDDNSNTVGTGKFGSLYSKDYGSAILDPLPHDKDYFSAHLSFAQDYFQKASGGKTVVTFKVLDNVIELPKQMIDYSPEINSNDISILGGLAQDVWRAVDNLNTVDFSKYNMFVIFHAGVGRDVSMPGSLGLERDLPSVFLNYNSLKHIFGDFFPGFSVNGGNFKITNSAILPETESREASTFGGTSLVQLSINGLIVSMIGSYLGLPDLYDTNTGKTAIGRFGLMDGQSIFAYGGCFPPMPSAWEKIYLGWAEPALLNADTANVKVLAQAITNSNETIYKVPINADEYYLVENRQRDVNQDGAKLRLWRYGRTEKKNFPSDEDGFYSYDVSSLYGVVTSVDEYDWGLPGNGIVIWHIDEKVIRENIADNKINANPERRGVDVEEADGIQDIGVQFQTIFGDIVVGEGDKYDFWYKGNPSKLYRNKFSYDTKPNTNSNEGGQSLITFSNFSENGNVMTFDLNYSAGKVARVYERSFKVDSKINYFVPSGSQNLLVVDGKNLKIVTANGSESKGQFTDAQFPPAFAKGKYLFGVEGNKINVFSVAEDSIVFVYKGDTTFTTAPVAIDETNGVKLLIGNAKGEMVTLKFNGSPAYSIVKEKAETVFNSSSPELLATAGDYFVTASGKKIKASDGTSSTVTSNITKLALTKNQHGQHLTYFLTADGKLYKLNEYSEAEKLANNVGGFSPGNIKNFNYNFVVYSTGDEIHVISPEGAEVENFPFTNSYGNNFVGTPLTADVNGDAQADVIVYDDSGNIFAINGKSGKVISPFPVSAGGEIQSLFVKKSNNSNIELFVVTKSGKAFLWTVKDVNPDVNIWGTAFADAGNSSFLDVPKQGATAKEYFPASQAYNWPNPVYGDETHIRFFVSEESQVEITIMDLTGEIVKKISDFVSGGVASEVVWNVKNVQSGVYFAHLSFNSEFGKSAYKIIKIAVIH